MTHGSGLRVAVSLALFTHALSFHLGSSITGHVARDKTVAATAKALCQGVSGCCSRKRNRRRRGDLLLGHVQQQSDDVGVDDEDARRQREEVAKEKQGEARSRSGQDSPLIEYFERHNIRSAELVPANEDDDSRTTSGKSDGGGDKTGHVLTKSKSAVHVKTVIFQAKGNPFAAVMREDLVADTGSMARHFRLPKRQITLAGAPFVEELTGFRVGTIPPVGHRTRLKTLVDVDLLNYSTLLGGAGDKDLHCRISVEDLVKATGASVIWLARPRVLPNGETAMVAGFTIPTVAKDSGTSLNSSSSSSSGRGSDGKAFKSNIDSVGEDNTTGIRLPAGPTSEASIAPSARPAVAGEGPETPEESGCGDGRNPVVEGVQGEVGDAMRTETASASRNNPEDERDSRTSLRANLSAGGSSLGTRQDPAEGVASVRTRAEDMEAGLRLVTAAMRTLEVTLAAISKLEDTEHDRDGVVGDAKGMDSSGSGTSISDHIADDGNFSRADLGGGGPSNRRSNALDRKSGVGVGGRRTIRVKQRRDSATFVSDDTATSTLNDPRDAIRQVGDARNTTDGSADAEPAVTSPASSPEALRTQKIPGGIPLAETVREERVKAGLAEGTTAAFGRELTRAAGTPTVDAIGGDVHLVALVGSKRSLTRLLHFVDLVPPTETISVTNQTCLVRKAWVAPGTVQGHPPRPVQVQLIMGKTLVDRMGEQEARVAMRGVKRGQLLYITGRPTPDTRLRFSVDSAIQNAADSAAPGTTPTSGGDGNTITGTYDLVCCSLRMLEDAPLVEPELVGKGDDWVGKGDCLKMDLDDKAVAYVDSPRGLKDMGKFLREELLVLATAGRQGDGKTATPAGMRPAIAIDCEWRPGRIPGEPQNPVCLMQLAAADRTFIVDMLHICRPKDDGAMGGFSPGLTNTEALLEEALGGVLSSPRVVKVGLGPKADFQSLMRSYPHMPCFRRVCGVINLASVASNASSLRGKPAEEKGSLSRLSNLVLGKPLDKSEQCSDWGNRPLSGRQKRYAALDARATLLIHQKLAPEVPSEVMESLFSTFAYDQRAHRVVETQTLPSYAPKEAGAATGAASSIRNKSATVTTGRRWARRGNGSRKERMARKQMLGVTLVDVSQVSLDIEGLKKNWLGRGLPGLTKEGVVRSCIYPSRDMPTSGELPTVLRFDRHQSFVEFGNGYALLMNCVGSGAKGREHASGFLDESGSTAVWYLQGKLSSDATMVDLEAAAWQEEQRKNLRRRTRSSSSSATTAAANSANPTDRSSGGENTDGSEAVAAAAAAVASRDGSESVGRFLQRVAEGSGMTSSILGGLPEDEVYPPPSASTPEVATQGTASDTEAVAGSETKAESPASVAASKSTPELVLFARAKGRPFVYCGKVDCVSQEYVWSAGTSRLGAVKFTLALREWREAAAAAKAAATAASSEAVTGNEARGGEAEDVNVYIDGDSNIGGAVSSEGMLREEESDWGDAFGEIVREGLRPSSVLARSTA